MNSGAWTICSTVATALLFGIAFSINAFPLTTSRAARVGPLPLVGLASWYDKTSCRREGTSGRTASGELLDDSALTAAMWNVPFGARLRVTNLATGASVVVRVNDRGPGRRALNRGRIIDLSRAAFADLDSGTVRVRIEKEE